MNYGLFLVFSNWRLVITCSCSPCSSPSLWRLPLPACKQVLPVCMPAATTLCCIACLQFSAKAHFASCDIVMVSTRSGAAANVENRRQSTSPALEIKTPRRNSLTPRRQSVTPHQAAAPIVEPPPSSTKKSLSWGESPQWNADVSIAEGHYGAPRG